jgi:hypothetical protein
MNIRKTVTVSLLALVCFWGVSCTEEKGITIDAVIPSLVQEGASLIVIGNDLCEPEAECDVVLGGNELIDYDYSLVTPAEFDIIVAQGLNGTGALKKNTTASDFDINTILNSGASTPNEKHQNMVSHAEGMRYALTVDVPTNIVSNCDADNLDKEGNCWVDVFLEDKNGKASGSKMIKVSASSGVTPSQNTCTTNDDCTGSLVCVDGECVTASPEAECETDTDCEGVGAACVNDTCEAASCSNTPITGKCDGNMLVWCDETTSLVPAPYDCTTLGKVCGEDPNLAGSYTCVSVQ